MKTIVLVATLLASVVALTGGAFAAGIPKKPITSQSGILSWAVSALGETADGPF